MFTESSHKFAGTVTVGSKGQIVIPVEARKKLNIKSGEKLLVYTAHDKVVGLVKADDIDGFMSFIEKKYESIQEEVNKAKKS